MGLRVRSARMLIQTLQSDPLFYVGVVTTVVVSIVLHELAHGWAAIWQGDDTPKRRGHITANPLVHMGGLSLAMLVLIGIAYGQMPVNPHRFRSRYGDALVAAAGPGMNLLLALLGLTALGVWRGSVGDPPTHAQANAQEFLWIFGTTNLVLCLFNLLPIPPLDGSSILANFHHGYRQLVNDPDKQNVFFLLFLMVFVGAGWLFDFAGRVGQQYLAWLAGF